MLLIAIPKSASSSLLETFGRVRNLPVRQRLHNYTLAKPHRMNLLYKYHSDMREWLPKHIQLTESAHKFFKQHIPPTDNNIRLLRNVKKVILLRDPKEIVEAYWRAEQIGIHKNKRQEFSHCKSLSDWLNEAARNGLIEDLQFFRDGWLAESNGDTCYIYYRDLIANPKSVINKMEAFWGLSITQEDIVLSKKRYTRGERSL